MPKLSFITSLALIVTAFGLAACSPGGPDKARYIGYTYTPEINDKSMEIWGHIATDLVDQMEVDFSLHKQAICTVQHKRSSLFLNSYQYALESELLQRGYTLDCDNKEVPHFYYESALAPHQSNDLYKNVEFTVTLVLNKEILKQTSLTQSIPAFYKNVRTSRRYLREISNLAINKTSERKSEDPKDLSDFEGVYSFGQPDEDKDKDLSYPSLPAKPPNDQLYPYYPPQPGSGPYPPAGYKRSGEYYED